MNSRREQMQITGMPSVSFASSISSTISFPRTCLSRLSPSLAPLLTTIVSLAVSNCDSGVGSVQQNAYNAVSVEGNAGAYAQDGLAVAEATDGGRAVAVSQT